MNPCLDNQTSLYLYVVYAREKINVRKLFYSKGTDVVFLVVFLLNRKRGQQLNQPGCSVSNLNTFEFECTMLSLMISLCFFQTQFRAYSVFQII